MSSIRPALLTEIGLHADLSVRPFIEAGFTVTGCAFDEIPAQLATGKYNVLLVGMCYIPRKTKQEERACLAEFHTAVERFVAQGGGVFFFLPVVEVIPVETILAPFGAEFLRLYLDQPDHTHNVGHQQYAYSTEICGPVADGVSGVWFPNNMEPAVAARPIKVTDDWQIVLRAGPGSHSRLPITEGYGLPDQTVDPNIYPDRVPLMALREGLPGRLAVCGIPGSYHLFSPHTYDIAHNLLYRGFDGAPSDLRQMAINTLRWLAEPSLVSGVLGGAETDPNMLVPQVPRFQDDPPVIWAERDFPPDSALKQGLIGARTAYSSGSGTVADYVAKAKAAGHDFIVFLEEFAALTAESFAALKADCAAQTTDDFFAVPGYTIADCVGSRCFIYGFEAALPLPDLLSDDGTILQTRKVPITRPVERVEHLHCNLIFGELKMRCRKGYYLHHASPKGLLQNRFNDSFSVITWENGVVIEDARDALHMLNDKGLRLNPTVLTFMNSPADFDRALAAGWRMTIIEPYATMQDTVLRKHMAPELEWWGTINEEITRGPRYRFDCWQYGNPFQVATSGPEVRAFAVSVSQRDTDWRGTDAEIPPVADWFRADVTHFRLRMNVASEVGLAEVLLLDGDRVIRRWQCNGTPVFERELDLQHHQQMHLMLEARDLHGGVAYTSDFLSLRLDWCEYYCADRNNPLTIGYEKDEKGLAYGWSGTVYLTYNNSDWGGNSPWVGRWWVYGDHVNPAPMDPVRDHIAPTDGGVGFSGAGLRLKIAMPTLDPPELGLMVDPLQEMISTDAAITGFTVEQGYDLTDPYFVVQNNTGFGLYGAYPTRYVSLTRRATVFRPKPHALTAMVFQHDLRWKRDPRLTAPLQVGWLDPGPRYVLHKADGTRIDLQADWTGESVEWRHDEALLCWVNGAQPSIFINDGAPLLIGRNPNNSGGLYVCLPVEELPTANAATTLRVIAFGGTRSHTDPNILAAARAALGFDGAPAYTVEMDAGSIIATRFMLALDGRETGAMFTIPQVTLPAGLPVTVANLNPNWPAVLLDRTARRWRPLGMLEGTAYATLDTAAQDSRLYIGHPVIANNPNVVISLAQIADDRWALEIHNPTGVAIDTAVSPSPYFNLLGWAGARVTLEAGTSAVFELSKQ